MPKALMFVVKAIALLSGAILRKEMETILRLRSSYGEGAQLNDIDGYLDLSFYDEVMRTRA